MINWSGLSLFKSKESRLAVQLDGIVEIGQAIFNQRLSTAMVLKLKQPNPASSGPASVTDIPAIVRGVINDIRANGDNAVRAYSEKFDKWSPPRFKLSPQEIQDIISSVPQQIIDDIKEVQKNVRTFAMAQRASIKDFEMEIRPGVHLGQKNIPINSVGA